MADITFPAYQAGPDVLKTLKDMGDGTHAEVVAFTADSPVTLTGDVVVDTLGALNDAKVTNPDAASATIPALERGQLAQLVAILAKIIAAPATEAKQDDIVTALGDIKTALDTANGLLDDIKTNTTPAP